MTPVDWRTLYPFDSHRWTLADGTRYHHLDEGRGEPLLMVHGNPTWSFYWRNLVRAFRRTHRVVVPDHVGCGMSDKPQQYDYSLSRHTANLVELIEGLDLRDVTLLAHDWGGAIGLGAVQACPERFGRLVLFNTGAFPPPYIPLRIRLCRTPVLGTAAIRGLNLFARAALRMAVERPLPAAVRAGLLAPYDSWAHRVAIDAFVRDIPQRHSQSTWRALQELEAGLTDLADRPIALIWGMRDWCFRPDCLDRFSEHWPSASVHRLADAGHYVVEDAHEQIVTILERFLDVPAPAAG